MITFVVDAVDAELVLPTQGSGRAVVEVADVRAFVEVVTASNASAELLGQRDDDALGPRT